MSYNPCFPDNQMEMGFLLRNMSENILNYNKDDDVHPELSPGNPSPDTSSHVVFIYIP